jgi:hypothetical protein
MTQEQLNLLEAIIFDLSSMKEELAKREAWVKTMKRKVKRMQKQMYKYYTEDQLK